VRARGDDLRQRLIRVLLLAFLIDTTRPLLHPAAHSHPNGERPHVHAGEVANQRSATAATREDAQPRRERTPAFAPAVAGDLHTHLFRTAHVSNVAPPRPTLAVRSCSAVPPLNTRGERTAEIGRPTARGPPTLGA
jgi:hypothetical protein